METAWLGRDGKPAANEDGYAFRRLGYDGQDNHSETAYLDTAGQPCLGEDKTHRWVKKFDARRNVLRWDFFGLHGEPIIGSGGYAGIEVEYNAQGQETRKTYLGVDGKPLVQSFGYATYKQTFTASGQLERADYYDADGAKTLSENGYCAFSNEYDPDGQLRARSWVGIPGPTAYQTYAESYVDGWKRTERFRSAGGTPVNGAVGYAQATIDRDEAGKMQRVIYLDAGNKPAYGEWGYAGAEYVSGVLKYYDAAGREMSDIGHGSVRPLLYVAFLRSADCVAAETGLRPGDILWQTGSVSYPALLDGIWEKEDDFETAKKQLYAAWKAALVPPAPVRVTVIRDGRLVELSYPTLPAGGVGVRFNLRRVPKREYDELVARFGPTGAAPAGHDAPTP